MIPIRDNILVRPLVSPSISAGGIIVSEAHKAISNKMEVIAVGNGRKGKPMEFKPGDIAFRVKGCGQEVLVDGELHFIVKDAWLLAKLD